MGADYHLLLLPPTPQMRPFIKALVEWCGWQPMRAHWFVLRLYADSSWDQRVRLTMRESGCNRLTAAAWLEVFLPRHLTQLGVHSRPLVMAHSPGQPPKRHPSQNVGYL